MAGGSRFRGRGTCATGARVPASSRRKPSVDTNLLWDLQPESFDFKKYIFWTLQIFMELTEQSKCFMQVLFMVYSAFRKLEIVVV